VPVPREACFTDDDRRRDRRPEGVAEGVVRGRGVRAAGLQQQRHDGDAQ
jgi:hypothetical protein